MSTAFWQQDNDKVILTFLGASTLTPSDVDVVVTQNSLRAGIRSTGISVCDGSLYRAVKNSTAYYGIKTFTNATKAVVIVIEKNPSGELWPTLFADGSPENQRIYYGMCTVQSFSAYDTADPSELPFPNGAFITVLGQDPSGWWTGFYDGRIGNLPSNFVNVLNNPLTPDVDDPNNVIPLGRPGGMPMGGVPMGGMPMGMPGMGRGFSAGLSGELGSALKRRTQMLQGGGGGGAPHRPEQDAAAEEERRRREAEEAERRRREAEEAERRRREAEEAERARREAEEAERRRQEAEAEAERQRQAEEAERQRQAAEAEALAQELARKQMEAMQAEAAAAANPSIPVVDNLIPGVTTVKATSSYDASEEGELTFREGDLIKVYQITPTGWWEGECNGAKGWFPANFVVLVKDTPQPQPQHIPMPTAASGGDSGGDILNQALEHHSTSTLRHSSRAKGPSKRAPTMHAPPKIQTWDSTEMSPEAGAAAAAAQEQPHRPIGSVGILPTPPRGGGIGPRGGRGGPGRASPVPPSRGGLGPSRSATLAPSRGRGRGGASASGPVPYARGGRQSSLRTAPAPSTTDEPQQPQAPPLPLKPFGARKAPPPRPDAASSAPLAQPSPMAASSSSSAQASAFVTDPSKMNAPKVWDLPIPVSDFCAQAAKLMKSVSVPGGANGSSILPDVKSLNSRALAICTFDGQVFVAGEPAGPSAQGAIYPILQAMLPPNVTRGLYSNRPVEEGQVATSAQNGCSISGAIAACSALIEQRPDEKPWDRLARLTSTFSSMCCCTVGFDLAAYSKAKKTFDLAWATAYAMKGAGSFGNNVADVMDLFFQLSSVQLTLPAAAHLAAALADSSSGAPLPSRDDALKDMRSFGIVNGIPVFGSESGLAIAAVPKIGGIAFWCPNVNSSSVPVVSREFFKGLLEKYQV